MTSYEELNEAQREQVDACMWLIQRNAVRNLDEYQVEYIKGHISNTILACLYFHKRTIGLTLRKSGRKTLKRKRI